MAAKERTFTMHWGSGVIAEEAQVVNEYHQPTFQLLRYTDGEAAGSVSIRFAHYSPQGRFQRSPLMMSEDDIKAMRAALRKTPELRALLKKLVD